MEVIGLTGGIGTGKSTASEYLKQMGFAIIDADQIARQVVEPGQPQLAELVTFFGREILKGDGSLDRKGLAALVFSDLTKRRQLDKLMHGTILNVIREQVGSYQSQDAHKGIIIDAPLLFETGLEKECSRTWLLVADKKLRIERVCLRDGMSPEEVRARIENQMDDAEKMALASVVIDNSGTEDQLRDTLKVLLEEGGFSCR